MSGSNKVHPTPGGSSPPAPAPDPPSAAASPSSVLPRLSSAGPPVSALATRQQLRLSERKLRAEARRHKALFFDDTYNRQQDIKLNKLGPDVDKPRSESELAVFADADKIVTLFNSVRLSVTKKYREYPGIDFRLAYEEGNSKVFLAVRSKVRCSPLDVIAKRFDFDSFATTTLLIESENNHHFVGCMTVTLPPPFLPRQFVNNVMWRELEITADLLSQSSHPESVTSMFQFVVVPTTHSSVPESADIVRGMSYETMFLLEHASSSCTESIHYIHGDLRGDVPSFIANNGAIKNHGTRTLNLIQTFQRRRDLEELFADVAYNRQQDIKLNHLRPDVSKPRDVAERDVFAEANKIVTLFSDVQLNVENHREYPGIGFRLAYKKGNNKGFLAVRSMVRCGPLDFVAKVVDFDDVEVATVALEVIERVNNHHFVAHKTITLPSPFLPRQFVGVGVWQELEITAELLAQSQHPDSVTSIFQFVGMPTTHSSVPESADIVRGLSYENTFLLEHASSSRTEAISYIHVDPRGDVPSFIVNMSIIKNHGTRALNLIQTFQRRLVLENLDEKDGKTLGESFILAKRAAPKGTTIFDVAQTVFDQHVSLLEAAGIHPALRSIIFAALENKLHRVVECDSKLDDLSLEDGRKIGRALASSLLSSTDPAAAVAEWIGLYQALTEMNSEFIWFEPMMVVIATRLLQDSNWGLIMRLVIGVLLSFTDVATDTYMILRYIKNDQLVYAYATIACIGTSIFLQAVLVVAQYHKASRRRLIRELAIVFSFTKPIWDTYAVCVGREHSAEQSVSPLTELLIGKGCELDLGAGRD